MSPAVQNADALFVERARSDSSYAGEEESTWAFLNRVEDRVFDRVRRLSNAWYAAYPLEARPALRSRLASGDDIEFHSAWFELYLHELHRRLGFDLEVAQDCSCVGGLVVQGELAGSRRYGHDQTDEAGEPSRGLETLFAALFVFEQVANDPDEDLNAVRFDLPLLGHAAGPYRRDRSP
jgi:hypothetical protein